MAALGNELVLFGGHDENSGATLSDTWTFDGATWTQVNVANAPPARTSASTTTVGGHVAMFGGQTPSDSYLSDTWTFDGSAWTLVGAASAPQARQAASIATLGTRAVLFGGASTINGFGVVYDDTWVLNGASWVQVGVAPSPTGRDGASLVSLGNQIVLFGGGAKSGVLSDTWTFDGTSWSSVATATAPPARTDATMASMP
jgi:N-acetylneuraminic acid mutarotase